MGKGEEGRSGQRKLLASMPPGKHQSWKEAPPWGLSGELGTKAKLNDLSVNKRPV